MGAGEERESKRERERSGQKEGVTGGELDRTLRRSGVGNSAKFIKEVVLGSSYGLRHHS